MLMEALKLILILAAILLALKRKVSVGFTLLAMGPLTAVLYQVSPGPLFDGYWVLLQSQDFISLTGLVVFVTILGHLLKELGYLDRLAAACQGLPGGARTAVTALPPLIGLMPMPGGSLLSAPLVNTVLAGKDFKPHFKCAANYWFRHMVEFAWPIYAGLVLTEALTGLPIYKVSLLQLPLTLSMLLIGRFFFARHIDRSGHRRETIGKSLLGIAGAVWPVAAAVCLYGLAKLELSLSALLALVALVIVARPPKAMILRSLKVALAPKLLILIFGVLSFQMVLELSGAIGSLPKLAAQYHLPPELVIITVCFTIGLLTGIVSAYVGLGYSLLAGLLYQPELNTGYIMLAYLSGFVGVILSPAHLCLILTNNYFGSDLLKVYRTLAWPLVWLGVAGAILYLSAYPSLFQ